MAPRGSWQTSRDSCKPMPLVGTTVSSGNPMATLWGSSAEFVGKKMMERLGSGSTGGLGEVHARRLRNCALKKKRSASCAVVG